MTEHALPSGVTIAPIRAFSDNYIWCIHNDTDAVVVDPGDAAPVDAFCRANNLTLAAILITHHHRDHTGGIAALTSACKDLPVIGPRGGHINGITKSVAQGDTVHLPVLNCQFAVLEVPGHTLDHIAFYGHGLVFCGDTLFSAGCGRLFEGSPEQMCHSLNKLKRLPAATKVYCTHEYTLANLKFALTVEPGNRALNDYAQWANETREQDLPTLPTTMQSQCEINPFLRCTESTVKASVEGHWQQSLPDDVAVYARLRQWKDEF